jgi:hypothetical protein
MPEITVIVPVYITKTEQVAMTLKCLSLAKSKTAMKFSLVIVESGGSHFSNYPSDIYIREKDAISSTIAMNRAFSCVRTRYTALLTNDVYVDTNWLECLLEPFLVFDDCGLSTLASTQFNHVKQDLIEPDAVWFSVAMWRTQDKVFDERFKNVWDDSDFTMRLYLHGNNSYRNHRCVVEHLIGKTQYIRTDHNENFIKGRNLFREKYSGCTHPMYKRLAGL